MPSFRKQFDEDILKQRQLQLEKKRQEQMPLERVVQAPAPSSEAKTILERRISERSQAYPEQINRLKSLLTVTDNPETQKQLMNQINTMQDQLNIQGISPQEEQQLSQQDITRQERLGDLGRFAKIPFGQAKELATTEATLALSGLRGRLPKESSGSEAETWFIKQNPDGTIQYLKPDLTPSLESPPIGTKIRQLYPSLEEKAGVELEKKQIETTTKLTTAVRRLAVLNKQFSQAFPSGDRTPLEQRILGTGTKIGAKYGLIDNAAAVALTQNIRPIAINLIRLFGEVGNLSESEQQGAIDVVNQSKLTDKERIAQTKQFIEFALAGADPIVLKKTLKQSNIQGILDSFGIDLSSFSFEDKKEETKKQKGSSIQKPRVGENFQGKKIILVEEIK